MTGSTTADEHEMAPADPPPPVDRPGRRPEGTRGTAPGAAPWLVVLLGVGLLLALFVVLALIAARAG